MSRLPVSFAGALCALLLAACSPKYDWREVRGANAPYVVLFPAKPASHTRTIDLGGTQVAMTMTAAEVDGVMFAVGSAELADATQAQNVLPAMEAALTRNIEGKISNEKSSDSGISRSIDMEARGTRSRILRAQFIANGKRVYQVVMLGKEQDFSREAADTFFTSFKAQ